MKSEPTLQDRIRGRQEQAVKRCISQKIYRCLQSRSAIQRLEHDGYMIRQLPQGGKRSCWVSLEGKGHDELFSGLVDVQPCYITCYRPGPWEKNLEAALVLVEQEVSDRLKATEAAQVTKLKYAYGLE